MKQTMGCEQFRSSLDAYLDSELSPVQRAAFVEHARVCPECGEKLEFATRLMTMCAEMDEGVQMPLDGQAAWRKAVRSEASQQKKTVRLPAFVRGLSAAAAALLVLAGGTYWYQHNGPLSLGALSGAQPGTVAFERAASDTGSNYAGDAAMPLSAGAASKGMIRLADSADDLALPGAPELSVAEDAPASDAEADAKMVAGGGIAPVQPGFDPSVDKADIKEVRYASRNIESIAFDSDLGVAKDLVDEYEGRIDDQSIYGAPLEPGQATGREAYLSARIPTPDLDTFLSALDAVGTVTARSESRQEITREYYDAKSRLDSLTAMHAELSAMVAQAQGVGDLIEIKRELANIEAETDSLNAQLSAWNTQVDYATVSINLSEVADKKAVKPIDSSSLMDRVKVGFAESINRFSAFAQDMLVFCVVFWPWILLALIVLIVVCASVRRRSRNRA